MNTTDTATLWLNLAAEHQKAGNTELMVSSIQAAHDTLTEAGHTELESLRIMATLNKQAAASEFL